MFLYILAALVAAIVYLITESWAWTAFAALASLLCFVVFFIGIVGVMFKSVKDKW